MIPAINSALNSLTVHRTRLNSAADNIANSLTDGFRSTWVTAREGTTGVPTPFVVRSTNPGPVYGSAGDTGSLAEHSNVDLAMEAVNMIIAEKGYRASLQVLETADRMTGAVLDIVA